MTHTIPTLIQIAKEHLEFSDYDAAITVIQCIKRIKMESNQKSGPECPTESSKTGLNAPRIDDLPRGCTNMADTWDWTDTDPSYAIHILDHPIPNGAMRRNSE